MPSLTVWLYPTAFGAGTGELHLRALAEHDAIRVHDAATIMWMPHDPEPRVRPVEHLATKAAGRGAMWGALVGLVLLNPVAGAAVGAGAGAAAQRLRRTGLDPGLRREDARSARTRHLGAAGALEQRRSPGGTPGAARQ